MKIFFIFWRKEKREIFLFEKVALLSFSDFERRRSSVLLQAWLRQAYQKIVVHVETNFFTGRFLESLSFFRHFRNSSKKFSKFWQEIFDRMVTTTLYMYRSIIWGKRFFFRKIHKFSRHLLECERQICGFFGQNCLVGLSGLHSPLLENHFWWKKNSDQKIVTSFFLELEKIFRVFGDNFTAGLSKFLCTCSDEDFEEKWLFGKFFTFSSFPEFQQKIFRVLKRIFRQGCHN